MGKSVAVAGGGQRLGDRRCRSMSSCLTIYGQLTTRCRSGCLPQFQAERRIVLRGGGGRRGYFGERQRPDESGCFASGGNLHVHLGHQQLHQAQGRTRLTVVQRKQGPLTIGQHRPPPPLPESPGSGPPNSGKNPEPGVRSVGAGHRWHAGVVATPRIERPRPAAIGLLHLRHTLPRLHFGHPALVDLETIQSQDRHPAQLVRELSRDELFQVRSPRNTPASSAFHPAGFCSHHTEPWKTQPSPSVPAPATRPRRRARQAGSRGVQFPARRRRIQLSIAHEAHPHTLIRGHGRRNSTHSSAPS